MRSREKTFSGAPLAAARLTGRDWLWLCAIFALAALTILLRANMNRAGGPFFGDTDDAMRMVVVRDFLAGQGWYDLVQHRLNTPYGAEIHWSRLVDLPLALLLALAQLIATPSQALVLAGTIWPLLLLALLLWLSARITIELVGRQGLLPALVLPVLSPAILAEFNPGRVDHHNVIIVLTLAVLFASLVALRRPLGAWLAGMFAATALAVAIEALPVAIAAILAFGFAYAADGDRRPALRRFGLGFAGAMVLHLMLARPPGRWLEAACDMISPVYVLAGLAVGSAYLFISIVRAPPQAWQRLLLLALAAIVSTGLVIAVYPQCLGGPYAALDPWLQRNWIAGIVEAKPWHQSLLDLPAYTLAVGIPILLGACAAILALRQEPEKRLGWLILLTFILATAVVMLAQIRGARLVVLTVTPAAAWLILRAREAYIERPRILPALGLVASWLSFAGIVIALAVTGLLGLLPDGRAQEVTTARASKLPCLASGSFADLRGLPPSRIMSPIDLGAHILLETQHEVVAAPYHRNEDGVLDAFRFLSRPAGEAHDIARKRGLSLFVTCEAMPEMHSAGLKQPNTVLSLLAAGTPPDWLEDVSLGGPLKIYAIAR
ncbi:hypothetical protein [Devosia rhizoryzae]|uniref:AcrB/AcrD/AcrF family protein n=1 Tax=Devosia rhizoryzae TaxID=2774137 RepID=A0ABX7CA13_9HYPH|nr:hypothetical protein [Devosia rhizoryzae]QQR38786.1 hypothetical protein JI748_13645 [Devosia rhizoryzae]